MIRKLARSLIGTLPALSLSSQSIYQRSKDQPTSKSFASSFAAWRAIAVASLKYPISATLLRSSHLILTTNKSSLASDAECRNLLARAYLDLFSARHPSSFQPFVDRGLIRPLPSIILKGTAETEPFAGIRFIRILAYFCNDEVFRAACTWPETIPALSQVIIKPAVLPFSGLAAQVLISIIRQGPRLHYRSLNDTNYDPLSRSPCFDYLYAHIFEDLRRINLATPNHPTLPLLALLESNGVDFPF